MKSPTTRICVAATTLAAALNVTAADQAPMTSLTDVVTKGSAHVSLRYRYENVDQDNVLKDAHASTLRTRVTLESGAVAGFSGLIEADNVSTLGPDEYDSLVRDKYRGTRSVVADPVGTEINQAYIKYNFTGGDLVGGRQRIIHGNQRFVGSVGWRQNEQTFDAFTVNYGTGQYTLEYSYLWGVDRIFDGSHHSVQDAYFDSNSHIVLATAKTSTGTFSGFVYALDFSDAKALSSITYGIGYTGTYRLLSVDATYATQSDYGDNPVSYDARYIGLEGSAKLKPVKVTLGYELLGSDNGVAAFSTPLATLHKFQGWADLFLATPANGIEDFYGGLAASVGKLSLAATYHDFNADKGGADYGREVDLVATYPITTRISGMLKYADYDAHEYAVDTRKFWFMVTFSL